MEESLPFHHGILAGNRIFVDQEEHSDTSLPPLADALRAAILDFDFTFQLDPTGYGSLRKSREIQNEASLLTASQNDTLRTPWHKFFDNHFLQPLWQFTAVSGADSRRTSRLKFYYDYYKQVESKPWTLFALSGKFRAVHNQQGLWEPRPSYAMLFPVYNRDNDCQLRTNSKWPWQEKPNMKLAGNFSVEILDQLEKRGLKYSPYSQAPDQEPPNSQPADLMCYPWLTCHHEDDVKDMWKCYFHAANASVAALMLLQNAAKHTSLGSLGDGDAQSQMIPAIPAMTTLGSKVTVWVSYCGRNKKGQTEYKMVPVWKGDVTNATDVTKLQFIMENIHSWAMRELKPWISGRLEAWKALPNPKPMSTEMEQASGLLKAASEKVVEAGIWDPEGSTTGHLVNAIVQSELLERADETLLRKLEKLLDERLTGMAARVDSTSAPKQGPTIKRVVVRLPPTSKGNDTTTGKTETRPQSTPKAPSQTKETTQHDTPTKEESSETQDQMSDEKDSSPVASVLDTQPLFGSGNSPFHPFHPFHFNVAASREQLESPSDFSHFSIPLGAVSRGRKLAVPHPSKGHQRTRSAGEATRS